MFPDLEDYKIFYINDRHEEADTDKEDRMKLYDKRILPLLGKGDLAVFGEKIDPFLWNYYQNLGMAAIKKENIFYVDNYLKYPSLTKALLNNQSILKSIEREKPDFLVPFIESEDTQLLAQKINCRTLRDYRVVEEINNKAIYRRIIKELGFPLIPGFRARNLEEGKKYFSLLRAQGFKRIAVKKERSVAGFGIFVVESGEDLEREIKDNFSKQGSFLLEGFIEKVKISPNVQCGIAPERTKFIIMSDQLFGEDKISHQGNIFPSSLNDADLQKKIEDLSFKLCDYMQKRKCYGFVGIDYLITEKGDIYSTEANVRLNASTFAVFIVDNLFGSADNIFWKTFTLEGRLARFEELFNRLPEVFINKKGSFGIFPVDVGILNSMGEGQFISIAQSREEVDVYINKLRQSYEDLSERRV